jgi:hypothetical protein
MEKVIYEPTHGNLVPIPMPIPIFIPIKAPQGAITNIHS